MRYSTKKINDICTIYDKLRKPISKKDRKVGIYPYYGASCIQDYVDDYLFDGRYVLIGEDGAKWSSGEETAYIAEGKFWVNNHAHIIKVNEDIVDTYVKYYFTYLDLREFVAGAIIPKLTQETLKNIEIPIPPLSEQQRIVDILDAEFAKIDALQDNAKKSIENAKALLDKTVSALYIQANGEYVKLGDIALFKNGLNFTKEKGEQEYKFIGVGDFKDNITISPKKLGCIYQDNLDEEYLLMDNDIIFVRSNGSRQLVGRCLLVDTEGEKVTYSGFCIRCRIKNNLVSPKYLLGFLSLDSTKQTLTSSGSGCNISNLNQKVLSDLSVPTPPLEEQERICSIHNVLREKHQKLQDNYSKTIILCNDLKQALLRKAFNGEL